CPIRYILHLFLQSHGPPRHLHSFPTRRSSDLPALTPCTPLGCVMLIRDVLGENLAGKRAVVVGRSNLVGKPVAQLLLQADCTVRSEEHTSELQSRGHLVCRLLLEKKKHKPTAT